MNDIIRLRWFALGVYVGYMLADNVLPPEPPKHKIKRYTAPHVVPNEQENKGLHAS